MSLGPEREGVIKFVCRYRPGPPLEAHHLADINAWRKILFQLELIGCVAHRYEGLGFGNISRRLPASREEGAAGFVISGTQTGGLADLEPHHYAIVSFCDPQANLVDSLGPIKPSSESLTHGILYQLDPRVSCVLHVHSPHIWRAAQVLELPVTGADVPYGTPAMAAEVRRLCLEKSLLPQGVLVMGGHEDGVLAFGPDFTSAGTALVACLARAYAVGQGRAGT
ncbi:class II aldolase/adducin family protein [Geoalkalibacter halelectricus]|uniref:Class II aldolase/adducin family protein n=1 Tax=Geoalkalibacter halelectricus TaxID=2847045 RepID=A0ABY5ZN19_9BACT|nr:class II aldolase/adducin family protein [Geoalkalibacter halelectricus]MDO3379970.1 class II aldolase/adducin family protein [Geoalkalibacter halelectricus]UWZ80503.1 class II aldolase/adducin family protein [Geoalkalibacter halelectricus]